MVSKQTMKHSLLLFPTPINLKEKMGLNFLSCFMSQYIQNVCFLLKLQQGGIPPSGQTDVIDVMCRE